MSPQAYRSDVSGHPEASVNRPRLVAYAVIGLVSLGLFFRALTLPSSRWEPLGAGTFPAIVLGLLTGLCLIGLVGEAMTRKTTREGLTAWAHAHRLVIFTFVSFALYVVVLPLLGFSLATFVFLLVVQLRLAPGTWTARAVSVVLAVVFSFGLNWLFADAFNIYLPRTGLLD